MYKAIDVANFVLWYVYKLDASISNLSLQVILYFLQAEKLVSSGTPLYEDDIVAWNWGPVIPDVYYEFSVYGSSHIPYFLIDPDGDKSRYKILKDDKNMIMSVVEEVIEYSFSYWRKIVQNQEPWQKAYNGESSVITQSSLIDFFKEVG